MLKLRVVVVMMIPGHAERGHNRHCLRNGVHPQLDLTREPGRVVGSGRRGQPEKSGTEVIHRSPSSCRCCLVEQNGLAAVVLLLMSSCGWTIVVVAAVGTDATSEKLGERSALRNGVVQVAAVLLVVVSNV